MKIVVIVLLLNISYCFGIVDLYVKDNSSANRLMHLHNSCHHQARGGFFSEFNNLIANLIYYEQEGIRSVYVDWTHPRFLYKDNPENNGWDLYFEPIALDPIASDDLPITTVYTLQNHELHDSYCGCIWTHYDDYFPFRLFAHQKIKQHIRIKKHIIKEVERLYKQYLENHVCIGVHVRYAKKHERETPFGHPNLDEYKNAINDLMKKYNNKAKIFLATDSHEVVKDFTKAYGKKVIYLDTHRAEETLDHNQAALKDNAHYHELKAGYRGGLGALMDCLLLAKCDYFIHITSNLAKADSFFNPYIRSIFLPLDAPYVPCNEYGNTNIRNPFINPF